MGQMVVILSLDLSTANCFTSARLACWELGTGEGLEVSLLVVVASLGNTLILSLCIFLLGVLERLVSSSSTSNFLLVLTLTLSQVTTDFIFGMVIDFECLVLFEVLLDCCDDDDISQILTVFGGSPFIFSPGSLPPVSVLSAFCFDFELINHLLIGGCFLLSVFVFLFLFLLFSVDWFLASSIIEKFDFGNILDSLNLDLGLTAV